MNDKEGLVSKEAQAAQGQALVINGREARQGLAQRLAAGQNAKAGWGCVRDMKTEVWGQFHLPYNGVR